MGQRTRPQWCREGGAAFAGAAAAASIMSHGYKKNKLLPHDDDDFVLLRFAYLAFTILTT